MRLPLLLCSVLLSANVIAADISVVGLFTNKAVLVIDERSPKTYSVNDKVADGAKLLSVDVEKGEATFEIDGKRRVLALGTHVNRAEPSTGTSVTLAPDERGHYFVRGQINGKAVQLLLDTGATMISMSADVARTLGIDYRKGERGTSSTANGRMNVYRVVLNTVRVGDIELNQIEAAVSESNMPVVLLGMSFLNRMDMKRDGQNMVLTRRY